MEFEKLYSKYISKKIPNYFTLETVDRILKAKYKAKEIEKLNFIELNIDPAVNYSNIKKCYQIYDDKVLESLFSDVEKDSHLDFYKEISSNYPDQDFRIDEGKLINIILESMDGKRISSFTVQGRCDYIFDELVVFKGLDLENLKLENRKFKNYLKALYKTGYL